jgi:hypothetical protein
MSKCPHCGSKYDPERIASELDITASGFAHHGNALRVAKDFPFLTAAQRGVLDRYATGREDSTDRFELQAIANLIRSESP